MTVIDEDREALRHLEESLWWPETRFDRDHMERVLADDFVEFGRSGRRYTRAECLAIERQPISARLPLTAFDVRELAADAVLVTYVSEVSGLEGAELAHRASVWTRSEGSWPLRFHQGTPAD
jgi:hypothetical protein